MVKFRFRKKSAAPVHLEQVPRHIAIIMDGNGRWAKKRMQPRVMGHKAGMDALQAVALEASRLGVKVLTVYAFSTENWARPEDEVQFILNLPIEFYDRYVPVLHENNIQIRMLGNQERLPQATLEAFYKAQEKTCQNTGLILNFALNYGGRAEIQHALQELVSEVAQGYRSPDALDEEAISQHLYTGFLAKDLRDPDLVIRTSGELRLSNFLPWQTAYSELYFTDIAWPDFDEEALQAAIAEFNRRQRRFGGV
nr:isoprenyl transferase [Streptococcus sp. DD13]